MIHDAHDPIRDHEWCGICEVALRRSFNALADLPLGPHDADELIRRLQELAEEREEDHAAERYVEQRRETAWN